METQETPSVTRPATEADLGYIASNLRAADAREFIATYGSPRYLEGIQRSAAASDEVLVGTTPQGNPALLMGIRQLSPRLAAVWACGTPEVFKFPKVLVQHSRPTIEKWFRDRPSVDYLTNFTHASNAKHHRWLKWCGAELFPAMPMGPLGELFCPFLIRRTKYHV